MSYIDIKDTDLKLYEIGYGTANLGLNMTQQHANSLLDAYVDMGGNYLDTAEVYSSWVPGEVCRSEKAIGRWVMKSGKRHKVCIGTKGAHPRLDTMEISRMGKDDVTYDLNNSLKFMNTDYIDIYWLHRDDLDRPVDEILGMMEDFTASGKIRYYACSNWSIDRIAEAIDLAKRKGYKGFIANQVGYNAAKVNGAAAGDPTLYRMDEKTYDFHKSSKLPVFSYGSQAGGLYDIAYKEGFENLPKSLKGKFGNDNTKAVLKLLSEYIDDNNLTPTQFALGYLLSQNRYFDTEVLIGTNNLDRQTAAIDAAGVRLPEELIGIINELIL